VQYSQDCFAKYSLSYIGTKVTIFMELLSEGVDHARPAHSC